MYWTAGGAGALALYASLGFWAVPAFVPGLLARHVQQELGRELSIADLRFNPFTLRLEASDLRLRDRDGSDLVAVGALVAQAQWSSVTRRAWSLAELRLVRPAAWPRIAPDGDFNFARLLAELRGEQTPQPDAPPPRLIVEQFAVEEGRVDFDDRRAGFHKVIAPVAFRLDHFSTLPEDNHDQVFSARMGDGGVLRWKGRSSLLPIRVGGELVVENAPLPEFAVYLKPFTRATLAAGRLDAVVPCNFSYVQGRTQAHITAARVLLRDVGVAHEGARDTFVALGRLELTGIEADLARQQASVAQVKASDGKIALRRDEHGELDLQALMVQAAGPAASGPVATTTLPTAWRVALPEVLLQRIAVQATDESLSPPLVVHAGDVALRLAVAAGQENGQVGVQVSGASLEVARLSIASGTRAPLQLRRATLSGGSLDLQARRIAIGKVLLDGAQMEVQRRADGALDLISLQPRSAAPVRTELAEQGWTVTTGELALQDSTLRAIDQGSSTELQVQDLAFAVEGAGSDLTTPVRFRGELALRSGGRVATRGRLVPATGLLEADVQAQDIALAPLQPLLAQYVRLRLAAGTVSARGRVLGHGPPAPGRAKAPEWQYEGAAHVRGLALNEEDGELFASWQEVGADRLRATVSPHRLDVPELRVVGAYAKLIIDEGRGIHAAQLLVQPPAPAAAPPAPAPAGTQGEAFPVRIRRLRLEDAKLDFTDLSLRPQFAAKVYELQGAINGLSTEPGARSQVELDGRVDEFGLARVRGELDAFSPRADTDLQVVFRNVNMVPASPYSMKFAGYRITDGRISLDLQYKVKQGRLEGRNQVVVDRLTLGERVESPDALKIPLHLALAILTDSNGRIDLGLPVSGSLDDPEFSYGAVLWKAFTNVLAKVVTAPFRALGAALGVSGEGLEAVEFDPGSARLLPPEREKLLQVADILAKRTQLKLAVPASFSEAADGAALRHRALRADVARVAGIPLAPDQEPGPIDRDDRGVRAALRELFAQRFGQAELDKEMAAAEQAASGAAPVPDAARAASSQPAAQRAGRSAQRDPQVAVARSRLYESLQHRLEQAQEVPLEALQRLGEQRAAAIVETLVASGVAAERASATAARPIEGSARSVPVTLELAAR